MCIDSFLSSCATSPFQGVRGARLESSNNPISETQWDSTERHLRDYTSAGCHRLFPFDRFLAGIQRSITVCDLVGTFWSGSYLTTRTQYMRPQQPYSHFPTDKEILQKCLGPIAVLRGSAVLSAFSSLLYHCCLHQVLLLDNWDIEYCELELQRTASLWATMLDLWPLLHWSSDIIFWFTDLEREQTWEVQSK